MTLDDLGDLSDEELESRLRQRGYTGPALDHYLALRDEPEVGDAICRILDGDDDA